MHKEKFKIRVIAGVMSVVLSLPVGVGIHLYRTRDGVRELNGEIVGYKNGKVLTGKQEIENKTYYFNAEGHAVNGWVIVDGKQMYFDEETKEAKKGVSEVEGVKYNFEQDGIISTGWQEDGTYKDAQGFIVKEQIVKEDGVEKVIDEKGELVANGWEEIDGKKFYFLENGEKATGKTTIEKKEYMFQEDGSFLTGWVTKEIVVRQEEPEAGAKTEEATNIVNELLSEKEVGVAKLTTTETPPVLSVVEKQEEEFVVEKENKEEKKEKKSAVTKRKMYFNKYGFAVKDKLEAIDGKVYAFDKSGYLVEKTNSKYYVDTKTKEARLLSEWEKEQQELKQRQEEQQRKYVEEQRRYIEEATKNMKGQVSESTNAKDLSAEERAKIAGSALAQASVNKQQDCTMLATNSLASVGVNFHGWPADYASLGRWVSSEEVQPGDLVIYGYANGVSHIAVVSGQGMAVHGGFNGSNTVNYSIVCSNPLIGFIRVQK